MFARFSPTQMDTLSPAPGTSTPRLKLTDVSLHGLDFPQVLLDNLNIVLKTIEPLRSGGTGNASTHSRVTPKPFGEC